LPIFRLRAVVLRESHSALLAAALQAVSVASGYLSHWVIALRVEGTVRLAKVPGTGSYAFLSDARNDNGSIGSIFGRPVLKSNAVYEAGTPNVVGLAGDCARSAVYCSVEGNVVTISDVASRNKGRIQL